MHDHSRDHSSSRIRWAFFLNLVFTIIEFVGGWLTNSTAIMADAVHDLGDSLSIGLAWYLNTISQKEADTNFTYGYRRFSLLGAIINGAVLVVGSLWVLNMAVPRLVQPEMPDANGMIALALLGVSVNGFAAYKLSAGKSLNERVLNWRLLEDVLGWCAVLIVGVVLRFVEWPILDPILSIGFTLFILFNVVKNLSGASRLFLQGAPDGDLSAQIMHQLQAIDTVDEVHHLHLWSLDGERHVLTAHIVVNQSMTAIQQQTLKNTIAELLNEFQLEHTTIELEYPEELCRDSESLANDTCK